MLQAHAPRRTMRSSVVSGIVIATTLLALGQPALAQPVYSQHDAPRSDARWPARVGALGCPAPQWSQEPGQRVLVVGDSLTREGRAPLVRALKDAGWNPTVRCWGGTRLDWALDQIRQAKRKDQLPSQVVIALGTNDMRWIDRARTQARVAALLDAIGPRRSVLWVDTYASGGDRFTKAKQRWFNSLIAQMAQERSNLTVARWGAFATANKVRFADALHYTPAGERAWARFVSEALGQAPARSTASSAGVTTSP